MSDISLPLKNFRWQVYQQFPHRKDAIMNLLDALSGYGRQCRSVIELSETPPFKRKYTSITDAIGDGLPSADWDAIQKLHYLFSEDREQDTPPCFLVDCTPAPRPHAHTLDERQMVHSPTTTPGNKPVAVGRNYSVVALLARTLPKPRDKHWLVPLSAERVSPQEQGHVKGILQIEVIRKRLSLTDKLCISVGDSAYGSENARREIAKTTNLIHVFRLASNRNMFSLADEADNPTVGRKKIFGDKMMLGKKDTHLPHSRSLTLPWKTARGKDYQVTLKVWENLVFRGARDFHAEHYPMTVVQVTVTNEQGKSVFKRPMWLAAMGERRGEISAEMIFHYYKARFDIEHFFRFGKQCLLLGDYQTPEGQHEESWWKLVMTAYMQLYLARSFVTALPKPWEKYQACYKAEQHPNAIHSPTQTQRGFGQLLNQIGTPARLPKQRGNPVGRKQGETQNKRQKKDILFKPKGKGKKSPDFNIPEFGQNIEMRETSKNSPIADLAKQMATQIVAQTSLGIQAE